MTYPFENLVFEGGGVKGVAYVGVVDALTEKGVLDNIKKVGGSSAGAIISILIGLGYNNQQIRKFLYEVDFMSFIDIGFKIGEPGILQRLFRQYGLVKGNDFLGWVEDRVAGAGFSKNLNFQELHDAVKRESVKPDGKKYRDMYFTGVNLETGQTEIYCHETTPQMRVADAVRISMSIPIVFVARPNLDGDICVDGGMLTNYPIRMFDYDLAAKPYGRNVSKPGNGATLGFRLSSGDIHTLPVAGKRKVDNILDYAIALLNCYANFQSSIHLNSNDWARTAHIDCKGVSTMHYNMGDDVKKMLEDSGRAGTMAYLDWYDSVQ